MYESEIHSRRKPADVLPASIRARFGESREGVDSRSLLVWGEHCSECAMPDCFRTCALYRAREDGKCRRFADGIVRVDGIRGFNPYVLEVRFRKWGIFHAIGNVELVSSRAGARHERIDFLIGLGIRTLLPGAIKVRAMKWRSRQKKTRALRGQGMPGAPSHFLLECYNPNVDTVYLTLTVRPKSQRERLPYQRLLRLEPGFTCERVPVADIAQQVDLRAPFVVDLMPNEVQEHTALYFGAMDFVRVSSPAPPDARRQDPEKAKACKCVAWDLDNTIWNGTLIEDGDAITLKPGVVDVMEGLDRRGILQTIVSKNNEDDARSALRRFGIEEYFLHPAISWDPKGPALTAIASRLNIALDTVLFVDDSPFERAEVTSTCPGVRVLDATEIDGLLNRPECQVPVTAESARRRQLYREQEVRESARSSFEGEYLSFLRHCGLELTLDGLNSTNLPRVHELTQRTNQMNFSGRRYSIDELERIMQTASLETFVMGCRDRFGDYGIVGFALVDRSEPRVLDLTFSCRVQSKRIEHAFLTFALRRYLAQSESGLWVSYRATERNAASGRVFDDLGFETVATEDGVSSLLFRRGREIPDDGLVTVKETRTVGVG